MNLKRAFLLHVRRHSPSVISGIARLLVGVGRPAMLLADPSRHSCQSPHGRVQDNLIDLVSAARPRRVRHFVGISRRGARVCSRFVRLAPDGAACPDSSPCLNHHFRRFTLCTLAPSSRGRALSEGYAKFCLSQETSLSRPRFATVDCGWSGYPLPGQP